MPKRTILILLLLIGQLGFAQQKLSFTTIPDTTVNSRVWILTGTTAVAATGSLIALNQFWYKDYARTNFHFFNDGKEWLQMDKIGHTYTAYFTAKYSRELWRWTGLPKKKQIWYGAASSLAYQSVIEVLDGFSTEWGFSWYDMGANVLGTGMMVAQELAWDEQRFHLKFSYHKEDYGNDPVVQTRTNDIFGTRFPERMLKDYNGQTYWLSANIFSFSKNTSLPKWLMLSVGYSAKNMYGGDDNTWTDANGVYHDYNNVPRIRQFYLSPDIDLTKIPTRKKGLKVLFQVLNMVKIPAPTLELNSQGRLRGYWMYF
ncbi:putative lipoprotein DUF2279 [Chitinophaga skermanii]|uniref:Putative lipoprotein DUF2279 n=1 Tax=Chitinophaga skermanii TaxID=331697 RepID=A0A327QNK1_9BACT|nr:DUF2279 domain-containing protein [Chitinophaga skermanii]RAJ05274.1 putative lipoprotein DUF2279 [Chitinophaga skermanii]